MGRLTSIKPRLQTMTSRLAYHQTQGTRSAQRDADLPWRKWYKTAAWQRLRLDILTRDGFTCQMPRCGKFIADTSRLVADHKIAHHGDHELFWDAGNLQCICKPCHDGEKQRQERGGFRAW